MNDMTGAAGAALLEIDLGAIADNWRVLAASHAGDTAAVVKADAYGLGAAKVVPVLYAAGCRHFFVAQLPEALALRRLIPGAVLAVLNGLAVDEAGAFAAHGITPILSALPEIAGWRAELKRRGQSLAAMLHVDTGMARLGLSAHDLAVLRAEGDRLDGVAISHVMTHLVSADTPSDPVNARQAADFAAVCAQFPGVGTSFANSSGMFLGPGFASSLARPGAALYGVNPTPGAANPMRGVVRLTAPILQIRELSPGESVGYNGIWTAKRPSRIAVLGVGYADGWHRSLSNKAKAFFDDTEIPLVGRVSMDLTTFDVTGTKAQPGDRLELLGPHHSADALAIEAGTNGYEILTALGRRYQRRYSGA
ncbi:MAG: alanine racemase [Acidocella sp.]|nr:alanine racemase [Acidocella sp.]